MERKIPALSLQNPERLFCLLVFVFGYAMHFVVKRLPLPEYPGLHPVGIIVDDAVLLLVALAATALMARFEHRSFAVYGLPRIRDLFGRMFWRGTVWGLVMPSAIILLIFSAAAITYMD